MRFEEVTEATIRRLVDDFYAEVRRDATLGKVFDRAIGDHWPEHLAKMYDFWSSVMLTSGRYKGNPMAVHLKHRDAIRPEMFGRWLELWLETARETLDETAAAQVIAKAERIAESLQLGMFMRLVGEGRAAA